MPILSNVLISTSRSKFANGVTPAATTPVLQGVEAFAMPVQAMSYKALPEAALESDIKIQVDSGMDIISGDIVTSITLKDGVTSWPGIGKTNPNELFRVVYAPESTPGPLAHRVAYVKRETGGGPVYA